MNDDDLRGLLDDAVGDVEPADRLGEIRARTASTTYFRRGWYAAGGAALVAAAAVVAVAVVGSDDGSGRDATETTAPVATTTPSTDAVIGVTPPAATTPVYYVGPGPSAEPDEGRLYRYFEPEGDPLELLMSRPSDPDYRTLWPAGSLRSYRFTDEAIVVTVTEPPTDPLATQQLVHTLQAATGTRLPVLLDHPTIDPAPVQRGPALDVLSHVSISDPGEDFAFAGSFTARGVANGYEGTVACRLLAPGGEAVWEDATIAGWGEDRLYPWDLEVDLTGLEPGSYTFECSDDDASGGEGVGRFTDTRTVVVRESDDTTDPGAGTFVYYVGPGPEGTGIPAEVVRARQGTADGPLADLMTPPGQDLETRWPAGSLVSWEVGDDAIRVVVAGGPVDDELARQQLIWTLRSWSGRDDLPVDLTWEDGREEPIRPVDADTDLVSRVSVVTPLGDVTFSDDVIAIAGTTYAPATVVQCVVMDPDGVSGLLTEESVESSGGGPATAHPWELRLDLSELEPDRYRVTCRGVDPDPAIGETRGSDADTRTITVDR